MDEFTERGCPGPGVVQGLAGGPMVFVRKRTARETQNSRAQFTQRIGRVNGVKIAIPNGGVNTLELLIEKGVKLDFERRDKNLIYSINNLIG